jgi:hypothetical protein
VLQHLAAELVQTLIPLKPRSICFGEFYINFYKVGSTVATPTNHMLLFTIE